MKKERRKFRSVWYLIETRAKNKKILALLEQINKHPYYSYIRVRFIFESLYFPRSKEPEEVQSARTEAMQDILRILNSIQLTLEGPPT